MSVDDRRGGEESLLGGTSSPPESKRRCVRSKRRLSPDHCYILQSMGCVKSKRSDSERAEGKSKGWRGEKAYLVHSETEISPQVNPVLLDYAQRLSEEIVVRAVQQWVEVDRRYCDIPYIECDAP